MAVNTKNTDVNEVKEIRSKYLVWIDTEATGLEFESDVLLEVSCIITDNQLNVVDSIGPLIIHCDEKRLNVMKEWPVKQHKSSGLWDECVRSKLTVSEVDLKVSDFIFKYCAPGVAPLCGNSVSFDREMIRRHMPETFDMLHYRIIDVSTIKELVGRWGGNAYVYEKKNTHRAMDDIRESIAELKWYKEKVFIKLL